MIDTTSNRESWQALADDLAPARPSVGKSVLVISGKHKGKSGRVTWHGVNKFETGWRYCSEAQAHLRDMAGTWGYRVRVEPATGDEAFFVNADRVEVIS